MSLSDERGSMRLKIEIKIVPEAVEPNLVIYTSEITQELTQLAAAIKNATGKVLAVWENSRIVVLRPEEVYMVRVEDEKTLVYGKTQTFSCSKRLYEIAELMGGDFLRISKSAIINLKFLDSVETSFSGMMQVRLKNGSKDYVSRKYLPDLKKYLGL